MKSRDVTHNRLKLEVEEAIDYQRMLIQEMVVNYLKNNDYIAAENVLRDMYTLDDRFINIEHHNLFLTLGLIVQLEKSKHFKNQ